MDSLPRAYVFAAFMAAGTLGKWRCLGHNPESVLVVCGHFQTLPVANGIGGYLADVVESPVEQTGPQSPLMRQQSDGLICRSNRRVASNFKNPACVVQAADYCSMHPFNIQ
jgi:hypothetical protein